MMSAKAHLKRWSDVSNSNGVNSNGVSILSPFSKRLVSNSNGVNCNAFATKRS